MTARATEPPMILDSARVLEYAVLDARAKSSARASPVVGGVAVDFDAVSGLVIAEDLVQGATFLLHCNAHWETLAAASYTDAQSARASAESAYAGIPVEWTRYRELTAQERAEIESTQRFLRELIADYPDE